jgi:hypothetical protein
MQRYPRDVVEICACGWPWKRQSTHSKDDGMRKRLAQEAAFSDDYAGSLLPEHVAVIRKEVEETLDAEVRSASLVEHIHAALRPLLATCRGQVDQAMLERCAYGHHHRRLVRGKRAGKAPIELLTGKEREKTWLNALLATA